SIIHTPLLDTKNLCVSIGKKTVLENISISLFANEWLMVCGPNGAGKSTLINAITDAIPFNGKISLYNKASNTYTPKEKAKKIAVLTQQNPSSYDFTVREIVHLGRYAWQDSFFDIASKNDEKAINTALEQCGIIDMQHRATNTLSGGELQRVFLAQAFAQEAEILLLDEPANHLDLVYQKNIFSLLKKWVKQDNHAILSVVHDLSIAKNYGTKTLLLDNAQQIAFGKTDAVLTSKNLNSVYGLDVASWMQQQLSAWN
ncbi:MAG TPA: ABC transporter ATP-binding protein, partial [Treponemataceae bacterium]|nr:ABC transporter ATP-binding protein [Treponemataceae bacterium]